MLAALALAILCVSLGARVVPSPRGPFGSATLALLSRATLGAAALAAALLAVGSAFGATRHTIGLTLLVAAAVAAWPAALAGARAAAAELGRALSPLGTVVVAVTTAFLFAGAAQVPTDFDALMYHLQGPATYLADGRLGTIVGNPHAAYLGVVHHLYLPLLAFGGPEAPALFEAIALLALLLALAALGDAWGRPRSGGIAALLLLASPMFALTAMTAKVDVAVAMVSVLGFAALVAAARGRPDARQQGVMAGLLFGTAIGIKAVAVPFALAAGLAVLPSALRGARRGAVRRALMFVALATIIGAAPWLTRNAVLYGNALYPTLGAEQPPAWLPDAARALGPIATEPMHSVRQTFSIARWIFAPSSLTPEGDGGAYALPLILLGALLTPVLRRSRADLLAAAAAGIFVLGVWLYQPYVNLRYLMPAIPLLALATAGAFAAALHRLRSIRPHARAVLAIVALVAITGPWRLFVGRALAPQSPVGPAELALLKEFTATRLPADARVLFLWEARGYGFAPVTLQDNIMKNWLYVQQADSLDPCLPAAAIDYVVVSRSTMQYLARRGLDTLQVGWDRFPAFQARCLQPLVRFPTHDLYAMRRPAASP